MMLKSSTMGWHGAMCTASSDEINTWLVVLPCNAAAQECVKRCAFECGGTSLLICLVPIRYAVPCVEKTCATNQFSPVFGGESAGLLRTLCVLLPDKYLR